VTLNHHLLADEMQVKAMLLCEHATSYQNGTFSVLNAGIYKITQATFPFMAPITVMIHAYAEIGEAGEHRFVISLRDENGQKVETQLPNGKKAEIAVAAQMSLQVDPKHPKEEPLVINFPITMPIVFQRPGQYQIRCDIDGASNTVPLFISQFQQAF